MDKKTRGREKLKIGVFGGSFDPVHTEHIRLVKNAVQSLGLDKVYVVPAASPPHKPGKVLSSDKDRLQMCQIAFSEMERAEVCDFEIASGGVSYTYLTCRHFRTLYPDAEIFWLVGTDMLRDFPTWKNTQSILSDVTLAVCARDEEKGWAQGEQERFFALFGKTFAVIEYNGADVSSTKIRVAAAAGLPLTEYTPAAVAAYIEKKGLYAVSGAKLALAMQKPTRAAHTLRVAETAAARAVGLRIPERQAICAALFHDCAKNIQKDSPWLENFVLQPEWGDVPDAVWHQFAGAYLAEHAFGVKDEDVLNAIRFHTSGRADMSLLEKLIFLADMVEDGRDFAGVENLRAAFWENDKTLPIENRLDGCLRDALCRSVEYLKEKGAEVYPLTLQAYAYYKNKTGDK